MKSLILSTTMLITMFITNSPACAEMITGEIDRIFPNGEWVNFRLKDDTCITGSQYYRFSMIDSNPTKEAAAKNWYTMLLSSAMANKPIKINVSECPLSGHVNINYMFQDY